MKYNTTTKDFPAIKKQVLIYLQSGWKKTVYRARNGARVVEVSLTIGKIGSPEGLGGFSYMSDQCSPALLKRIAAIQKPCKLGRIRA